MVGGCSRKKKKKKWRWHIQEWSLGNSGLRESNMKPRWQVTTGDRSEEGHRRVGRQEKGVEESSLGEKRQQGTIWPHGLWQWRQKPRTVSLSVRELLNEATLKPQHLHTYTDVCPCLPRGQQDPRHLRPPFTKGSETRAHLSPKL